ncbi:MAG: DUF4338 domain-containing protein [Halobacteria archaeon]|nr:DUF4338 domain-containing protein [Halobacteria archaeon]
MTQDQQTIATPLRFCGKPVSHQQLALITQIVTQCGGLSRTELASTVCELLDWKRPNGKLKTVECRQFLEQLQVRTTLRLPPARHKGRGRSKKITLTSQSVDGQPLQGTVKDFQPVSLRVVSTEQERRHFRELIERHHYLGYRIPFGAQLCYLIEVARPCPTVVGAIQLSSPAWRMAPRDRWIGWTDAMRARHLQRIVNNSRFLILPFVRIKCLASHALSLVSRRLVSDWQANYHIAPLLLETLVDIQRFSGVCYRAANWLELGQTSGRGRQDRQHARHGAALKRLFIYPLRADARESLRSGEG